MAKKLKGNREELKCPSTSERINKMEIIYIMKYYLAIKEGCILFSSKIWIKMLS